MAQLPSTYKKALIDEILSGISSNTSFYYAVASNPVSYPSGVPADAPGYKTTAHITNWTMLFGKKLTNTNIMPMVLNNMWAANTVYAMYDDTIAANSANLIYTVVTAGTGADYLFYKCIYNNHGAPSTNAPPTTTQFNTITMSDGYMWRYVASVPASTFAAFSANGYVPIVSNASIVSNAAFNSSVDVVVVSNGGSGYIGYNSGNVGTVSNSTTFQIGGSASSSPNLYAGCAFYLYNTSGSPQGQLLTVASSNAVGSQRWITTTTAANLSLLTSNVGYIISPSVVFDTDGVTEPKAYLTINSVSNSVNSVVIVDPGSFISRANASVSVSNSAFGSGAVIRAIVPPPGGHGSSPTTELELQGMGLTFSFSGSESNTIPTNILYNKIGIIKNPYVLNVNAASNSYGIGTKGSNLYSSNTFTQVLKANVSPSVNFTVGSYIGGNTSGANGVVAFSNSTVVWIAGDKNFSNGETVTSDGLTTTLNITSYGAIYAKELMYLYAQNTDNINHNSSNTETFKVMIKL